MNPLPPGHDFEPDFPKDPPRGDSLRISDAQNRGDRGTPTHFPASFLKSLVLRMYNNNNNKKVRLRAEGAQPAKKKRNFFKKLDSGCK